MYPQTDWYAAFATTAAFGVTVATSPRGVLTRRGGSLAIGVISCCNGRVHVTPREGLNDTQTAALLAQAWCAWQYGPIGSCWKPDPIAGMVATAYLPLQRLSMTVSRAMAMSSAEGSPRNPPSDWLWS